MAVELTQQALAQAYDAERSELLGLEAFLTERISQAIKERGISADVKGRTKTVESFVVKALLGRRYTDPMTEITDKVGMRVMLTYLRDKERAVEAVASVARVLSREEKRDALAYNEVGYQGVHLDIQVAADPIDDAAQAFGGLVAEVQIRTRAQAAWAEVSHEQLYKPAADVPDELKRRVYRLVALAEIFDDEVEAFLIESEATPGFQAASALGRLQAELLRLGGVDAPDRELTRLLAEPVVDLYEGSASEAVEQVIAWVMANEDVVRPLIEEARELGPEKMNLLLAQPEVLMLLERLENDSLRLKHAWPPDIPDGWLVKLAEAFGHPIED